MPGAAPCIGGPAPTDRWECGGGIALFEEPQKHFYAPLSERTGLLMEAVDFMDTETHVTNPVSILGNQGHV